jgi:subtilisin family serine protease
VSIKEVEMQEETGRELRKLAPKLRMIANASEAVNTLRAEQCSVVAVKDRQVLDGIPQMRGVGATSVTRESLPDKAQRGKLAAVPGSVYVNVFIELLEETGRIPEPVREVEVARKRNLVTATVPQNELQDLIAQASVAAVETADRITFQPPTDVGLAQAEPPAGVRAIAGAERHRGGAGVLIGIIDVNGFDFAHPDFLDDDGNTRFVKIWDQGGTTRPSPHRFDYGAEIDREHMNAALKASPELGVPAQDLEPQSQMVLSSHGTHVASIAAGKRGMCPAAYVAGVVVSLPAEDLDRRTSFYDSTRIAHAVDYLFDLGGELGVPVSINISLGTNGHAHDASTAISRWIDYALATPGRSVCVAAGNAGQEAPSRPGDWGFVLGRIHTSGRIPAANLTENIEWVVVGDGIADISENELEIWYSPQDRFAVEIKPPDANTWIGPVEPGEFIENLQLEDGSFVSVYNELYTPANGHNYIACYLSPFLSEFGIVGVPAGTWIVRLHGRDIRDGSYHGWIERDDPHRWGKAGMQEAWSFPSFFSTRSNVDNSSVSSLACGQRIVSVANLEEESERINISSSQGPTRDGRTKPEIAAPGTAIVAANGFDPYQHWVSMSGTSMASPYVAGVVGLMLAVEPQLTAAQIVGIIRRTARPLPGADFAWRNDAGFGRIDPEACLEEAARVNQRRDLYP